MPKLLTLSITQLTTVMFDFFLRALIFSDELFELIEIFYDVVVILFQFT